MPDEPKPASPPAVDYQQKVRVLLKQMRADAVVFDDKAFEPHYTYNNSSLKQSFNSLSTEAAALPGIPPTIRDQVTNLEHTYKDAVQNLVKGEFKESNWSAPFEAIQKSITQAKEAATANPAAAAPGQSAADLDKLSEQLKTMSNTALNNELKKMHDSLKLQNDLNLEKGLLAEAMNQGPYKNQLVSTFMANDWRNEETNDLVDKEQLENAALTTGIQHHTGADGIYSKEDSHYKVSKRTDSNGVAHYLATYSNQPKGDVQETGEALLMVAVSMVRFWGSISGVIPALEALSTVMAGIGMVVSGGRIQLPYSLPFTQLSRMGESVFDNREGNVRDQVKAEIDVAQRRGRERDINVSLPPGTDKMSFEDLARIVHQVDVLKEKAGYKPGPNGTPGTIGKPKTAMGLNLTTEVYDKLSAILLQSQEHLDRKTQDVIKSFHKSQNNGSGSGYDPAKYKEYIMREILNYRTAVESMRQGLGIEANKTNTSTITPTVAEKSTSTITPTKEAPVSIITPSKQAAPLPEPSAPPMDPAQQQQKRQMAEMSLKNQGAQGADFKEVVKSGIDQLKQVVAATYDNEGNRKDGVDTTKAEDLKGSVDNALKVVTEGEKVALENDGSLEVYRDAEIRMGKGIEEGLEAAPPEYDAAAISDEDVTIDMKEEHDAENIATIAAASPAESKPHAHITREPQVTRESEIEQGPQVEREPEVKQRAHASVTRTAQVTRDTGQKSATSLQKAEVPVEDKPAAEAKSTIRPGGRSS